MVLDVPPSLREAVGRKRLRKTTGTREEGRARQLRHAILAEMHRTIEAARGKVKGLGGDKMMQEGVIDLEAATNATSEGEREAYALGIEERVYQIAREHGEEAAKRYYGVATGLTIPISLHHEAYLAEKKFAARQVSECKLEVARLGEWLQSVGIASTVQAVADKVASRYKAEALVAKGVNFKTANKRLSSLRSYWAWLMDHGHTEQNPWLGKSLPKERLSEDEKERAFTDEEFIRLFESEADAELKLAMYIAAYSGMRIEEIFRLRVKHCQNHVFKVAHDYKGKTKAAARIVPIHSFIFTLIWLRTRKREPDEFLLQGSSGGWGDTRSMACSKRFHTLRMRLGIDEKLPGKRRSLVNFHSFRRWFITKADQAGCRKEDIERVVGHRPQGESLGTYSKGITLEQARAVVESVKYPAPPARPARGSRKAASKVSAKGEQRGRRKHRGAPEST